MPPMNVLLLDGAPEPLLALLSDDPELRVVTAADGAQALEMLLAHDVGLALLDIEMPGMDGYALAELMRGSPRTRPIPIVFLTAVAPHAQRSFAGDASAAVDFLCKPVDPRLLRSKVQVFLELHRQRSQLAERMAELERLARLNALMIGALSHDIRTPLAAMTLNAELVSRRHDVPAVQQAGMRLKAATAMLSLQVDHLVNLASMPTLGETPRTERGELAALVRERLQALPAEASERPIELRVSGDSAVMFDPAMVARAIDRLLLLAMTHGGAHPLTVDVDGNSRRAVLLRLRLPEPLGEAAQRHLFGTEIPEPGMPPSRVGPGLDAVERVARAHGGSVIGRSNAREARSIKARPEGERALLDELAGAVEGEPDAADGLDDRRGGVFDRTGDRGVELAESGVDGGSRPLDPRQPVDHRQRHPLSRDREVVDRLLGLGAVQLLGHLVPPVVVEPTRRHRRGVLAEPDRPESVRLSPIRTTVRPIREMLLDRRVEGRRRDMRPRL